MRKKYILNHSILTLSIFICITACIKDNEEPKFNVQIRANGGGTIEGQCGEYNEGESIEFKASPDDGYFFAGWSDSIIENPRIIVVNKDIDVEAIFISTKATVDLGLTSGTLWAICNVGATKPWEFGNYYAWGEIETKSYYDWSTYKYCDGDDHSFTKYCNNSRHGKDGFIDNLTSLEPADDAATANWGTDYAMPTYDDWEELFKECYWVRTNNYFEKKVSGYIVYKARTNSDRGKKIYGGFSPSSLYSLFDAHIFLPAAYCHNFQYWNKNGADGCYWSASLYDSPNTHIARGLAFFPSTIDVESGGNGRASGFSVRPVRHN